MANLKFSQFQEQTDPANVQFVVGYNGTDNVRIDPANLGGGATDLNGLSDCSTADGSSVYVGNVPPGLSGSSLSNTVLGNAAGNSIVSGFRNTLVGRNAGDSISFGDYHVCIGNGAGGSLTTANETVCIGNDAGGNSTASDTVIIGASSGRNAISTGHISIGYRAGFSQTSGAENTFLGFSSAYSVTTGSHNTVIGYEAGYASLSGDSNTLIGASAGYSGSNNLITGSNNIIIGHDASPSAFDADNEITLGNSSIASLRCQVQTISSLSDSRDKTNIKSSTYGLDFVNKLNPVTFDWNTRDGAKVGDKDLGFIAQELQVVDDENLQLVYDKNPDKLEASYGRLIPVLVKAIQELKAEIELLK